MIDAKFGTGMIFGVVGSMLVAAMLGGAASARPQESARQSGDNQELARLYDEDQADRSPAEGKAIDWAVVGPRDKQREARVKNYYESGDLRTGKDHYRAAMVLQHAGKAEDYLLAHELCVVALSLGERDARWLAAASEDRFLTNIGRSQRFGTQYRSAGTNQPFKLQAVEPGVTDGLRRLMAVPTLDEARAREAKMNEK